MTKQLFSLWILFLLITPTFLSAQTNVSGIISSNTTWTLSGSPYILIGNVEVPAGVQLTILPGVEIQDDYDLIIKGSIICNGKPDTLIKIWSARLLFKSANLGNSKISFTNFSYKNGGALVQLGEESETSQDSIKNSGILTLTNVLFSEGSFATTHGYKTSASLEFINSKLSSGIGTILRESEPITLTNCEIQASNITSKSKIGTITLNKCIASNSIFEMDCCEAGLTIEDSKIIHATFQNSPGPVFPDGPLKLKRTLVYKSIIKFPGAKADINHCIFINEDSASNLMIGNGTIDSSSFIGNFQTKSTYLTGYNSMTQNGTWTMNHCTFFKHLDAITTSEIQGLTIHNSNFSYITGYTINSGSSVNFDTKSNWWGTTDQSSIAKSVFDKSDDSNRGSVDFANFLLMPDQIAPISPPVSVSKKIVNNGVELSWSPNKETDAAGYKIYTKKLTEYSFINPIDVGNVSTYFIPSASITDTFAITAYDQSTSGINDQIEGHESWFTDFASPGFKNVDTSYCSADNGFTLIAEPSGGVFTGPGINGTTFTPSQAGPGKHELLYIYQNANGTKNDTVTANVTIYASPIAGTLTATQTVICKGSSTQLTLSGYTGSIQWQQDSGGFFDTIPGATSSTYNTGPLNVTTNFRVRLKIGSCYSFSNNITISIVPTPTADTLSIQKASICLGDSASIIAAVNFGNILWQSSVDSITWTNISGVTGTILNTGQIKVKTFYRTIVSNSVCPSDTTNIRSINVFDIPTITIATVDPTFICGTPGALLMANFNTDYLYQWLMNNSPISGANSSSYLASQTGNYSVKVISSKTGCSNSSALITVTRMNLLLPPAPICIVGVDSTIGKNSISWEKPVTTKIDSFFIYKETALSNVYTRIGKVDYNSPGKFIDMSSNPNVQANRYKISILDSCGSETPYSNFHQTIYLSLNQLPSGTWNLSWNSYKGFNVSYYRIYRGSSIATMQLIGTTTSSNNFFTDFSAPSNSILYYRIDAVNPNACSPSFSKSNIVTNDPNDIADYVSPFSAIEIYPVPNNGKFTIDFYSNRNEKAILKIVDVLGSVIFEEDSIFILTGKQSKTIALQSVPKGVYFLVLQSESGSFVKKVLIE